MKDLKIQLFQIPSARLGRARRYCKCSAFSSSVNSDYINGETLHVNGGMYMA